MSCNSSNFAQLLWKHWRCACGFWKCMDTIWKIDILLTLFIFSSPELKAQVRFLAHLSSKLKWAFLIAFCLPSVCPLNIYIFDFFRTAGPILTRLGTKLPWAKGIQNCTNEGPPPSSRGDNSKRVKIHWKLLKIFSWTSRPISIKLGTNHPSVKGIQNCTYQGPGPF
jgi:hypothetical protein